MDIIDMVPKKDPNIVTKTVEGQTVLVPPKEKKGELDHVFSLNGTGAEIWNLIDGKRTVREILHLIELGYEVEWSVVNEDGRAFITQLSELGMISFD